MTSTLKNLKNHVFELEKNTLSMTFSASLFFCRRILKQITKPNCFPHILVGNSYTTSNSKILRKSNRKNHWKNGLGVRAYTTKFKVVALAKQFFCAFLTSTNVIIDFYHITIYFRTVFPCGRRRRCQFVKESREFHRQRKLHRLQITTAGRAW